MARSAAVHENIILLVLVRVEHVAAVGGVRYPSPIEVWRMAHHSRQKRNATFSLDERWPSGAGDPISDDMVTMTVARFGVSEA